MRQLEVAVRNYLHIDPRGISLGKDLQHLRILRIGRHTCPSEILSMAKSHS